MEFIQYSFGSSCAVTAAATNLLQLPSLYFEIKLCFFSIAKGLQKFAQPKSDTKEQRCCIKLLYILLNSLYRDIIYMQQNSAILSVHVNELGQCVELYNHRQHDDMEHFLNPKKFPPVSLQSILFPHPQPLPSPRLLFVLLFQNTM